MRKEAKDSQDSVRAVEEFVNHVTRPSDINPEIESSHFKPVQCALCNQKLQSQNKYEEHLENIHMSWIPPDSEKRKNLSRLSAALDDFGGFPIVPFSSVPDQQIRFGKFSLSNLFKKISYFQSPEKFIVYFKFKVSFRISNS